MVRDTDHFSFTADFLEHFLADLENFSCFLELVYSSFRFDCFQFLKRLNFQPLFPFFHLFANRDLENKIENITQHIKKPI